MRPRVINLTAPVKCLIVFLFLSISLSAQSTATIRFDAHDLSGIWNRTGGDRGYNNQVPPMTPLGLEKLNSNKPSYGRDLDSADAAAHPEEHMGRRRAVPPALGNDP